MNGFVVDNLPEVALPFARGQNTARFAAIPRALQGAYQKITIK